MKGGGRRGMEIEGRRIAFLDKNNRDWRIIGSLPAE
jgi:hypothetical protein